MDKQRTAYVKAIDPKALIEKAHSAIKDLAVARENVDKARRRLQTATAEVEAEEARLTLSEGYAAGKNKETRDAWLIQQRRDDFQFCHSIEVRREAERCLAASEASFQTIEYETKLFFAEVRLATAQLAFLAEV